MLDFVHPDGDPDLSVTNMIAAYHILNDRIEATTKLAMSELEAKLQKDKASLETITQRLTAELLKLGPDEGRRNIKTTAGTVYRKHWDRFKVADRDAWIGWLINTESVQMITNHVSPDNLKEYMEEHNGQTPPGISREHGYTTHVTRSK